MRLSSFSSWKFRELTDGTEKDASGRVVFKAEAPALFNPHAAPFLAWC